VERSVCSYGGIYSVGQTADLLRFDQWHPQHFEYESLSMVCFSCGRYGHVKESCPKVDGFMSLSKVRVLTFDTLRAKVGTVKGIKAYVP
ncbi:hypothetical protein Golax_004111, partial [Gossypium laxum]|nr:hypothetical protein [Gossypium laxum]